MLSKSEKRGTYSPPHNNPEKCDLFSGRKSVGNVIGAAMDKPLAPGLFIVGIDAQTREDNACTLRHCRATRKCYRRVIELTS